MRTIDFRAAAEDDYSLCVVGAGPAGLALALKFAQTGRSVLIVELGDEQPSAATQPFLEAAIGSDIPHDPVEKTVVPALGGTSCSWGGRVVPFDREDFDRQPGGGQNRWPLTYDDYMAWLDEAAVFLGCEPSFVNTPPDKWRSLVGLSADRVEQLSPAEDVAALNKVALSQASTLSFLFGAVATGIRWAGEVDGELVAAGLQVVPRDNPSAEPIAIRAQQIVVCTGGLEATRLLLSEQKKMPDLFGGPDGTLGRYYVGHITGSIADICFTDPQDCKLFGYQHYSNCGLARRRLTLNPSTATNIAFWVANPSMSDPTHGSASLSVKYLAKRAIGAEQGGEGGLLDHTLNVVCAPTSALGSASRAFQRRLQTNKRSFEQLVDSKNGIYRLHYHAGQFPRRKSHVMLGDEVDPAGRPRLIIRYTVSDADIEAVLDAHKKLERALAASSGARLRLRHTEDALFGDIRRQARDGYHQISTTRMHECARKGIVDADCKVHGTSNLYIAAASIFPVAGQANPTLSVVMFAQRLASHLINNSVVN